MTLMGSLLSDSRFNRTPGAILAPTRLPGILSHMLAAFRPPYPIG